MKAIIYELKANDVSDEDIELILSRVKNRVSDKNLDIELVRLGYNKIFTVDYDEFDDGYDDDLDSDFSKYQKKHSLED